MVTWNCWHFERFQIIPRVLEPWPGLCSRHMYRIRGKIEPWRPVNFMPWLPIVYLLANPGQAVHLDLPVPPPDRQVQGACVKDLLASFRLQ